ncbi:helix-turn-helix domain-containing protein [Nonomuraea jabiensis]|uniref:helix-turn-helix domain-containing protein n=1 Tax=Nonomuraea jabiensis TaxID=882448 RepID=UPI003F4DACCA
MPRGRARRERLGLPQPHIAVAGIPSMGVRRVPDLRREEVAMLADISADYYLRLEQSRDRTPSAQVLESLARVLQLDDDAATRGGGQPPAGRVPRPRRA